MDIRDYKSVLTEWILKFSVIFFIASLFFDSMITQSLGQIDAFKMGFIIKIVLIAIFGILLSVLEKNIFKIAAFATIIVGSVFKILVFIGSSSFNLSEITGIADYILLIGVSVYYLQRHFRKSKKYHSTKTRKLETETAD